MSIPVEAIQGYLLRAGLKFAINDQGNNGQFMLTFETRRYRNPSGENSLMVVVTVSDNGHHLEVAAVNAYSANDAKNVGTLCEYLMGQNYALKLLRWELDRCDGEIRALADAAPVDGGITYEAFMRMLMMFPVVLDSLHTSIAKVMATAKLPVPVRTDKRLRSLVQRAGGIDALEKLVRAQEQASRESATIDPALAAKLGLDLIPQPLSPQSDQCASLPLPPSNGAPDGILDEPSDDTLHSNDDGPCSCDSPVEE